MRKATTCLKPWKKTFYGNCLTFTPLLPLIFESPGIHLSRESFKVLRIKHIHPHGNLRSIRASSKKIANLYSASREFCDPNFVILCPFLLDFFGISWWRCYTDQGHLNFAEGVGRRGRVKNITRVCRECCHKFRLRPVWNFFWYLL